MGVVVRRYIDFLRLLIPTPLVSVLFCTYSSCICSFLQQHPNFFVHKKFFFSFLFQYFFVIKFYVLNIFWRSINTHTGDYGHPTAAI